MENLTLNERHGGPGIKRFFSGIIIWTPSVCTHAVRLCIASMALARLFARSARAPAAAAGRALSGSGRAPVVSKWKGKVIETSRVGLGVVQSAALNKGTSFPYAERDRLGIRGLVPPGYLTLEQQHDKTLASMRLCPTPMDKHLFLAALQVPHSQDRAQMRVSLMCQMRVWVSVVAVAV